MWLILSTVMLIWFGKQKEEIDGTEEMVLHQVSIAQSAT
jgi:hypothetical protein